MHMRQFIFTQWIKFWRLFWSDLEAYMMALGNVWEGGRYVLISYVYGWSTFKYISFSVYPDHFLVLACITCDIVVIWKSTYLSSISNPAANMHLWMFGLYYQHWGWTTLMMSILTVNTITLLNGYNTLHGMHNMIWLQYNTAKNVLLWVLKC